MDVTSINLRESYVEKKFSWRPTIDQSSRFVAKSIVLVVEPHFRFPLFDFDKSCLCESKNFRNKKRGRKLTTDWHREIKLEYVIGSLYRFKGDSIAKRHPGYKEVPKDLKEFCTSSTYKGFYNVLGFAGTGEYMYPHGVRYNGSFKNGHFHGEGTLTYPMGQQIDGIWNDGRLMSFSFRFADGLEYSTPWKYCQQPDRSFQAEVIDGLHPAGAEYLTNQQPTKPLKPHCYDTVDGYFSSITKCVYKDEYEDDEKDENDSQADVFHESPEILRICTQMEEDFIVPNYRKEADDDVGYRPDLYEHWTSGISQEIDAIKLCERKESEISTTVSNLEFTSSSSAVIDSCSMSSSLSFHDSIQTN